MLLPMLLLLLAMDHPAGRIGDLTYDSARWTLTPVGADYRVTSQRNPDEPFTLTVEPGAASACEAQDTLATDGRGEGRVDFSTVHRPGFDVRVASRWLGCRNARPPSITACAAHAGLVYRIDAMIVSCAGGPGFSGDARAFISGLTLAEPATAETRAP